MENQISVDFWMLALNIVASLPFLKSAKSQNFYVSLEVSELWHQPKGTDPLSPSIHSFPITPLALLPPGHTHLRKQKQNKRLHSPHTHIALVR
jgi:hypothetical protein